jgi:hypothetical protein
MSAQFSETVFHFSDEEICALIFYPHLFRVLKEQKCGLR